MINKVIRNLCNFRGLYKYISRKTYILLNIFSSNKKIIVGDNNNKYFGRGWETVDMKGADHVLNVIDTTLPFKDNEISLIYTSHMIGHITNKEALKLFKEFFRILRPGGFLRISAPNSDYYINSYKNGDLHAFDRDEYGVGTGRTYKEEVAMCVYQFNLSRELLTNHNLLCLMFCSYSDIPNDAPIFTKNDVDLHLQSDSNEEFIQWCSSHYDNSRRGGHINGFNAVKTINLLKEIGFLKPQSKGYRESSVVEFKTNPHIDLELRKNISFYVEVKK